MNTIESRLKAIRARIASSIEKVGRAPGSVQLLAVSKTFGPTQVRAAASAGQRAFGENYIQEGVDKILALRDVRVDGQPLQWHCIGPIQSNKTRLVAEHFDWVHTVDRLKIAQRLNEQRPDALPPLQVCLQVNVDNSSSKSGLALSELPELLQAVSALPRLRLRGLMCIPDPADNDVLFSKFVAVHQAFSAAEGQISTQTGRDSCFDTLSMGMSADLELAIAAGSTMVRVGSAIFGSRGA